MTHGVRIDEIECLGFKAYKFTNDVIELVIVPEIGGRIMGYGYIGNNILYQNPEFFHVKPDLNVDDGGKLKELRLKTGYLLYGGEKTWIAPQEEWEGPPYMDLDNGSYSITIEEHINGVSIKLTSPICRETKLRIIRKIEFPVTGSKVDITQFFENLGEIALKKGLWQVTMLKRPGRVILPCSGNSSFINGVKIFESDDYEPAAFDIENGEAVVTCENYSVFKVGTDVNKGYADTMVSDASEASMCIFHEEFMINEGPYGHGCVIEVFNSHLYPYFEVEIHSPLVVLEPKSSYEYRISWSLQIR